MEILEKYPPEIEKRLRKLMEDIPAGDPEKACREAMIYSAEAGGKRIRPALVCAFSEMTGGSFENALDPACALEMIHTFSLIHDDLPCMDNDDMRRGKPSCHKKFGEVNALLAGDALECYAFEVIADSQKLSPECKNELIKILAKAVGVGGMIGGQVIDTANEGKGFSEDMLLRMYSMKTCALIRCACAMGCICGGRRDLVKKAEEYGEALGLAFQIVDDILDITSDTETLGKPAGSDKEQNKSTYPAVFGLYAAREKAAQLTARAVETAGEFPCGEPLVRLTESLLYRIK